MDDYIISFSVVSSTQTPAAATTTTSTTNIEELNKMIAQLLAQIAEIQQKIAQLRGTAEIPQGFKFGKPLYLGLRDNLDIKYLQIFLKNQGVNIYPEGLVTGYFGNLTRKAVIRFQLKEKIVSSETSPGAGLVGIKTRAKVNEILGR